MKKFKKPLVINLPEDDHRQISSPTQLSYKETKQRPLLTYNQHTIASSVNNQDQALEYEDRSVTCEQFAQFHVKTPFETKASDHNETHEPGNKIQKYKKMNVIQFEEFNLQGDKPKSNLDSTVSGYENIDRKDSKNNKRQFSIEIPQNEDKDQKPEGSTKFSFDIRSQATIKPMKQNFMKQPPAPSNKTKMTKTLTRHFVFPTNDEEMYLDQSIKKEKAGQKILGKFISEEDHEKKIKQLIQEWSQKLENVNKSFEKERQQFYKQKSSLEKDLMIKDGQIEMLQKLITNRYSPKEGNNINYYHTKQHMQAFEISNKDEKYKTSFNNQKPKGNLYVSDEKITTMETVLLEKDLQINSLLQKINELNAQIDKKNNELEDIKVSLMKSQKTVESLRNQVFIFEKKEQSEKITKQFYKMKQTLIQVQQSSKTPKSFSRTKWQQQLQTQKQKPRSPEKNEYPLRGIDDLHKRLQSLKMNRIQLESRGRIKSELGYPQTSKNKTKGTFDFKGKFYDRDRDYINQTRMY